MFYKMQWPPTSQVLCRAIVLIPPIIISDVYSSMARLLSPTYGTYLITTWNESARGRLIGLIGWFFCPRPHRALSVLCVWVTHTVVRFLSGLVQYAVRLDHVIHHVALGDLFGAELLRSGQVFPVVVAEVIVADDGGRLSRAEKLIKFSLFRKYNDISC